MKATRRVGTIYTYRPAGWDRFDAKHNLASGELVRVIRVPGCPPPGTMGHTYVERLNGQFVGLVCEASLAHVVDA